MSELKLKISEIKTLIIRHSTRGLNVLSFPSSFSFASKSIRLVLRRVGLNGVTPLMSSRVTCRNEMLTALAHLEYLTAEDLYLRPEKEAFNGQRLHQFRRWVSQAV